MFLCAEARGTTTKSSPCTGRVASCAPAHEAASYVFSAVFDSFSSVLPSCDALELEMNFLHFVLSSKTF